MEEARADATQSGYETEQTNGDSGNTSTTVPQLITTSPDSFGVFRRYSSIPSHNPKGVNPFTDVHSSRQPPNQQIGSSLTVSSARSDSDPLADSENPSLDILLSLYSEGPIDGASGLDRLLKSLQHPLFDPSKLKGITAQSALRQFEKKIQQKSANTLEFGKDWKRGSVTIRVPCVHHRQREEDAPEFTVDGVWYRDAVEVITNLLKDPDSFDNIHLKPFEEWWCPLESNEPVRVYSETYTSDAMLQLQRGLEETLGSTIGPQLETFILAALFYSDGTRLAQFGHASLWPLYMFVGNTSKYIRSQPNTFSAHHIAYLPTV